MGSKWKKNSLMFFILSVILLVVTGLNPQSVQAADDEGSDYSFYTKASQLSSAFEQEASPQTAGDDGSSKGSVLLMTSDGTTRIVTGQAAGLLGYSETTSDQKGVYGWLHSELSTNSASYNHDQLGNVQSRSQTGDTKDTGVLISYAHYGKILNDLGFDNTAGSGSSLMRLIFGGLLYLIYIIANIAPMFFVWAIKLIKLLNPFQLVGAAIAGLNNSQIPGFLGTTVDYVSGIYEAIQNLSAFVILPVMVAITLFSVFVFRRTAASKKIVRLVVRAFMMFGGVALIGATFTGLLDKLDDMTESGTRYADYVVVSSFVDFEAWAQNTRLALPASYGLADQFMANDNGDAKLRSPRREVALRINAMAYNDSQLMDMLKSMNGSEVWSQVFNAADANLGQSINKDYDAARQLKATTLLGSYMKGDLYYSSSYEGYAKSDYNGLSTAATVDMFTKLESVLSDTEKKGQGLLGGENETIAGTGRPNTTIYSAGSLGRDDSAPGNYSYYRSSSDYTGGVIPTVGNSAYMGGLTPLGMYNYLNTKFESNSLVVYSPVKSSSGFVKESHRSVNFVAGSGLLMFVGYVEVAFVLIFLAAISLMYAFGLMQVALGSITRILPGIFGSAVGSLGFITKLLVSTVVLLVEIVGTVLLYGITQYLSISIMVNLDSIFNLGSVSMSSTMLEVVKSILVIIILGLLLVVSFKNRTKFVKAMEETVTNIISKLMGALDNNINEGNALGNNADSIRSGVTSGTGADKENDGKGVKDLFGSAKANAEKQDRLNQLQGADPMSATDKAVSMAGSMGRMMGAKRKDLGAEMFGMKGHALDSEMEMEQLRMTALENDARSSMGSRGHSDVEQASDFDDNDVDMTGISPDGSNIFDDDSGMVQAMDADDDANAVDDVDADGSDNDGTIKADDNGNERKGVKAAKDSDAKNKGKKDGDKDKAKGEKHLDPNDPTAMDKDGKKLKAGEVAGTDGIKDGNSSDKDSKDSKNKSGKKGKAKSGAIDSKGNPIDAASDATTKGVNADTTNAEASGMKDGSTDIAITPDGDVDSPNYDASDNEDTEASDNTESVVYSLGSDMSLNDLNGGQSSMNQAKSSAGSAQGKKPGMVKRQLGKAKSSVKQGVNSANAVIGAAREGYGDGRYGEVGNDARKAQKAKQAGRNAVRSQREKNGFSQKQEQRPQRTSGSNAPITKFANGSDIRVMSAVPVSKLATSMGVVETTPMSGQAVQERINNLVNTNHVSSYDTYKAAVATQSQALRKSQSAMEQAHTRLTQAKTGDSFSQNNVAQYQAEYNKAKNEYTRLKQDRQAMRRDSVALVHTEGMPSSVVTGSKFKGDPIYARNTLNNLAKIQQERMKLRNKIETGSRYGQDSIKAKKMLNQLTVDQSKLKGALQNAGFDMDLLGSPKSIVNTASKFENEFKDYIDGKK